MRQLISNELNVRALINNINKKVLPNLLMLTGPYGTGKTEFSKDIARMITCDNLTSGGYCGHCEACKTPISEGLNAFNAQIQLLNMEVITYEQMENIVLQATQKHRTRSEVFIFDEFHRLDKDAQEIWLAETSKLTDCYIIMTTTDKRSIAQGIHSRSIQIQMKTLTPLQAKGLIREHYPNATDKIVQAIVRKAGGSPRELINLAQYYHVAELSEQETISLLTGTDTTEVIFALEALSNREEFFKALKSVRMLPDYQIRNGLQEVLWGYIGGSDLEKNTYDFLDVFSEKQIIDFLSMSNVNAQFTLLKMFQAVTVKPPINDDVTSTQSLNPVRDNNEVEEKHEKLDRW